MAAVGVLASASCTRSSGAMPITASTAGQLGNNIDAPTLRHEKVGASAVECEACIQASHSTSAGKVCGTDPSATDDPRRIRSLDECLASILPSTVAYRIDFNTEYDTHFGSNTGSTFGTLQRLPVGEGHGHL